MTISDVVVRGRPVGVFGRWGRVGIMPMLG